MSYARGCVGRRRERAGEPVGVLDAGGEPGGSFPIDSIDGRLEPAGPRVAANSPRAPYSNVTATADERLAVGAVTKSRYQT